MLLQVDVRILTKSTQVNCDFGWFLEIMFPCAICLHKFLVIVLLHVSFVVKDIDIIISTRVVWGNA